MENLWIITLLFSFEFRKILENQVCKFFFTYPHSVHKISVSIPFSPLFSTEPVDNISLEFAFAIFYYLVYYKVDLIYLHLGISHKEVLIPCIL